MSYKTKKILINTLTAITTLFIIAAIFLSLMFACFGAIYIKSSVRGFSMYPTLNESVVSAEQNGDTVFINRFKNINRNDIVVANVEWWPSGAIIKRVVGLPGDEIQILELETQYNLIVNGEVLYSKPKEDDAGNSLNNFIHYQKYLTFLSDFENSECVGVGQNGLPCIKVRENEYFLVGDNWNNSVDSLTHGAVSKNDIIGRVDIIVKLKDNYFFSLIGSMLKIMFN